MQQQSPAIGRTATAPFAGVVWADGIGLVLRQLRAAIRENAAAYALIVTLLAVTLATSEVRDDDFAPFLLVYARRALAAAQIVLPFAVILLLALSVFQRDASPLRSLWRKLATATRSGLIVRVLLATCMLVFFMGAFLFNKMLIPEMSPFAWDRIFAELDRALFLGTHPWQWLHPLIGFPEATQFLDMMYSLWIVLMVMFWAGAASDRVPRGLGRQYLLSAVITWIVAGLVLATLLSSAGPTYFPLVSGGSPDPYIGLNTYLDRVADDHALPSDLAKTYLWLIHTGEIDEPGGISAMPSMHNAQALLFAVFAFRLNRVFGAVMAVYAAIIFIGSIHLAWHYAVDSIAGMAIALLIWRISGVIVTRGREQAVNSEPSIAR